VHNTVYKIEMCSLFVKDLTTDVPCDTVHVHYTSYQIQAKHF